jgi:hypothetical protein
LLQESKDRGEVPTFLDPSFTTTHDSYGVPWATLEDYTIECGRDLKDVLDDLTAKAGIQWKVRSSGIIDAGPTVGDDVSYQVRFFPEIDVIECEDTFTREETRTAIYVATQDKNISFATDATQITRWGRRAMWIDATEVTGATKRQRVADAILRSLKTQRLQRRLKVDHDPVDVATARPMGRRMFHDYKVGSLIGYGQKLDGEDAGEADFRVLEVGVSINDGVVDAEITVQSLWQKRQERYQRLVDRLLKGKANTAGNTADATYSNMGGGSGGIVYVQPDDPGDDTIGALWFDTDATC